MDIYKGDRTIRSMNVLKQEKLESEPCCYICRNWFKPILQIHHILFESYDGEDSHENTVLLCPNCHKTVHYSLSKKYKEDQNGKSTDDVFSGYLRKDEIRRLNAIILGFTVYRLRNIKEEFEDKFPTDVLKNHLNNGYMDVDDLRLFIETCDEAINIVKSQFKDS